MLKHVHVKEGAVIPKEAAVIKKEAAVMPGYDPASMNLGSWIAGQARNDSFLSRNDSFLVRNDS